MPPTFASYEGWYSIIDWLIRKEVREEVGLEIGRPRHVTDLVFIRPDGFPVLTLSYWAPYRSGKVELSKELTDHAWVTREEAKSYDLIEGIWHELAATDAMLRGEQGDGA